MKIKLIIASLLLITSTAYADFDEFTPASSGGQHSSEGSGDTTVTMNPHCRSTTGGSTNDGATCTYCASDSDCLNGICNTTYNECTLQEGSFTGATDDYITRNQGTSFANTYLVHVAATTLPAGLAASTDYYVVNLDAGNNRFKLSSTSGGTAIDLTSTGSGSITVTRQGTSHLTCPGTCTSGFCLAQSSEAGDGADECSGATDCDSVCTGVHQGKGWEDATEPAFLSQDYDSVDPGAMFPSLNPIHCYASTDPDVGTPGRYRLHDANIEYCDARGYRQIVVRQGANKLRIDGRIWSRASTIFLEPASGYDLDVNMSSTGSVDLNTKTLNVFAGSLAGDLTAEFSGRTSTDDTILKLGYAGTPLFAIGQDGADANKLKIVSGDWGSDSTYEAITITSGTLPTIRMNSGGDLIVDAYSLFVDASTNRVGIGTAAPGSPLDVLGEVRVTSLNIEGTTCLDVDTDQIYHDTNCNDTKDTGEKFIDGFPVTSDSDGFYLYGDSGTDIDKNFTIDINNADQRGSLRLVPDKGAVDEGSSVTIGCPVLSSQKQFSVCNGLGTSVYLNLLTDAAGTTGNDGLLIGYDDSAGGWVSVSEASKNLNLQAGSSAFVKLYSSLQLNQSADPSPTAEGVIEWETDTNEIHVGDGSGTQVFVAGAHTTDTNTNAITVCAINEYLDGNGDCADVLEEAELDTLAELNAQLTDATLVTTGDRLLDWGAYCLWCNIASATPLYPIVGFGFTTSYNAEVRGISYVERACTTQNIRGRLQGCNATSATRQLTCEPRQNQADITSGPELVFGDGYTGGDWVTDSTTVSYAAADTVNWACACAGDDCPMGTFCTIRLQMECAY